MRFAGIFLEDLLRSFQPGQVKAVNILPTLKYLQSSIRRINILQYNYIHGQGNLRGDRLTRYCYVILMLFTELSEIYAKGEMLVLGTVVNAAAIILGSLLGYLLKEGIPEKINTTIMQGLGLCVIFIGISGSLSARTPLLIIISIVIGAVIGEWIDIDEKLKRLGDAIEKKLNGKGGSISEGFVTASLVYCIGAMAIIGSLRSGLLGDHTILFSKSMIDGVSAVVFTTTLGIGVALSGISVLIYQGMITLASSSLKYLLLGTVITNLDAVGNLTTINDLTAVGSLLIIGIGTNMLGITKIRVANLLPAVVVPVLYGVIRFMF